MKWFIFFFMFSYLSQVGFSEFARKQLIIWNVGQGSWATAVLDSHCLHFDMGGELAPYKKINDLCRDRKNRVYFSHWDMDHISFSRKAKKSLPNLCHTAMPGGHGSYRKKRMLKPIQKCPTSAPVPNENDNFVREIPFANERTSTKILRTPNSSSRVFVFSGILLPGDSTIQAEKIWATRLGQKKIKWLIAGHHGSKTSTSKALLDSLPHLVGSIVSARRARFGHPHPVIKKRLADKKIPVLLTEDWGHIHLFLD